MEINKIEQIERITIKDLSSTERETLENLGYKMTNEYYDCRQVFEKKFHCSSELKKYEDEIDRWKNRYNTLVYLIEHKEFNILKQLADKHTENNWKCEYEEILKKLSMLID